MKYLKYSVFIILVLLAIGTGYFFLNKHVFIPKTSQPVTSTNNVSVFSYFLTKERNLKGIVKPWTDINVKEGARPVCTGEYYLDTGSEIIWLTHDSSGQEDRISAYKPYTNKTIEAKGTFYDFGNACDTPENRKCECFEAFSVTELKTLN